MWPVLLLGLLFPTDVSALTIPPEMMVMSDPIEIKKEEWIDALHMCENKNDVVKILDVNGKYSYGAYMFQMGTWLAYGKEFGATRDNIGSSTLQRKVVRDMLDDGGAGHWWNCSKLISSRLGAYPHNP